MRACLSFLIFFSLLPASFGELAVHPARGFYTQPILVTVTSTTPGEITYTLDGSAPDGENGLPYREGLKIVKNGVLRAAVLDSDGVAAETATHSYLFVGQVRDQEAHPPGYVNAIGSWRLRYEQTFDWAMDAEVLDDVERNGDLADHLLALPSLSVVLSRKDFNFLYENHPERGGQWERPASVELLYPPGGALAKFRGFQIHCGIRMQGGGAVIKARKKSFRLLFKKDYGPGKLKYPLFESAPHHASTAAASFDNVILRAGGNANWSKDEAWKHEPTTYLRDPLVRDSQIAVCGFGARSTFVHLYINGFYFGLYNIAERPDDKFQASYWGGRAEDYHSFNHGGSVSGDGTDWDALLGKARRGSKMADLSHQVDIPALCDYLINQWYFGSGDWPWNNYYGGLRVAPQAGPVRFFTWDAEFSLWTHTGYLESNDRGWANPLFVRGYSRRRSPLIILWNALAKDPDFKITFADRVYKHCFQDGALTERRTKARFAKLMHHIEGAIVAESARWGDSAYGQEDDPRTRHGHWRPECRMLLKLLDGNVAHFVEDLQSESLYPSIAPPLLAPGKGPLAPGSPIALTLAKGSHGKIYLTTDASDPRTARTGAVAPGARIYSGTPFTLKEPAWVKARVLSDAGEWSALAEQLYLTTDLGFPIRITELMVNPKGAQALEFIELTNLSAATIPLGNCRFEGIDYQFPPEAQLPGKGVAVLIPNDDPAAFAKRYPRVKIAGHYRQHLANTGETIRLLRPEDGAELIAVRYGAPWPRGCQGQGRSLQVRNRHQSNPRPGDWKASAAAGGSPGK